MNKARGKNAREVERQQQLADIQNAVPKELKELKTKLDMVYAQNRVLVSKVHNTQVEMSQLNLSLNKLAVALLELAQTDTIPSNEAEAILRDFLFNKHKK